MHEEDFILFKVVSEMFQECFKVVSWKFHRCLMEVLISKFHAIIRGVSGISRMFQGNCF